ncbi:15184_t:CDS:1, partial [Cetraspora pellucida]
IEVCDKNGDDVKGESAEIGRDKDCCSCVVGVRNRRFGVKVVVY